MVDVEPRAHRRIGRVLGMQRHIVGHVSYCEGLSRMTPNPRLHRTLNQRRCACWFRAGEAER